MGDILQDRCPRYERIDSGDVEASSIARPTGWWRSISGDPQLEVVL